MTAPLDDLHVPFMKHLKTAKFRNFFSGAKRFAEIEKRIEALPTKKERGDAMEVFAEAYLRTIMGDAN